MSVSSSSSLDFYISYCLTVLLELSYLELCYKLNIELNKFSNPLEYLN